MRNRALTTALLGLLVLSAALVGAACSADRTPSENGVATSHANLQFGLEDSSALVEVPARDVSDAFLDPDASPTTQLGRLRAQYLPVWSADLDWAFPPDVCGSAWELDAIARPDPQADVVALGDAAVAAVLSVMRFEHLVEQANATPSALAQLCVAVTSVDPVRADTLSALEPLVRGGSSRPAATQRPAEVAVLASAPGWVLAVACSPGMPESTRSTADSGTAGTDGPHVSDEVTSASGARLGAYLLALSAGREDSVTDVSWRVAQVRYEPTTGCGHLHAWSESWSTQAQQWSEEGQAWLSVDIKHSAQQICDSPPPDGPDECPEDWAA